MLEWLLLCLPRKYSEAEINFHRQRCLRKIRRIVDLFNVGGICDKSEMSVAWHQLAIYSLPILRYHDPKTYRSLSKVNSRLMKIKLPEGLSNLVSRP
jgi:hypothetical protein